MPAPLHRSELRTMPPEALAEMCADIMAILAELDCIGMIAEAQAERRAAMMGIEREGEGDEHGDDDGPPSARPARQAQFVLGAKR